MSLIIHILGRSRFSKGKQRSFMKKAPWRSMGQGALLIGGNRWQEETDEAPFSPIGFPGGFPT